MKKIILLLVICFLCIILYAQEEAKKPEGGTTLTQYGILGTIVAALAGYILRQDHLHRRERDEQKVERKEWQEIIQKQFESQEQLIKDNNKEWQLHSNILTELKVLIQNEQRRRAR